VASLDGRFVCWRGGRVAEAAGAGVPGMTYEIGGESLDLGPRQGEPNIEEARARPGIDRAVCRCSFGPVGFREGGSEGGRRCAVVANGGEAP